MIKENCVICGSSFIKLRYRKTCSAKCSKELGKINHKNWAKRNPKRRRKIGRDWARRNPEQGKNWVKKNRKRSNQIKAKWRRNNPEKNNRCQTNWMMKKYHRDVLFRWHCKIGNRIRYHLSKKGYNKGGKSWKELTGYSVKSLRKHLESQFTEKINWNNYGTYWEIDHVVPMSWFKTKKQILKWGWRLDNLQPLEKNFNRRIKSNAFVYRNSSLETPAVIRL